MAVVQVAELCNKQFIYLQINLLLLVLAVRQAHNYLERMAILHLLVQRHQPFLRLVDKYNLQMVDLYQ